MRQLLVEGATGAFPFIVDRSKPLVVEQKAGGGSLARIPGRFSVCDCVNGNNRRYRKAVWEKNLKADSLLQEAIKRNGAFGLLEHPKDGIVTLQSPISHQVTKAELIESKDATGKTIYEVVGEISLYNPTLIPESAKLLGLIEGGYNPLVSSRGYGSLQRAADGVDEVQEDYVCESWDVVIKPSFEQAELTPQRDAAASTQAHLAAKPQPESLAKSGPQTALAENKNNLKESPSTGAPSPAAAASNSQPRNYMELNEIRSRISALRSTDPTKLRRFAESMQEVESLHQQIAEWGAADAKRNWDTQKLHKELDGLAEEWTDTAKLPAKQAKKLGENNLKLMKVINAVASTALTYKKKLGEALKASGESQKLKEELTRRGQGWRRVAEERSQKLTVLEKDFADSCEALDMMSKRYHEDTTELARRLIVLEFKEKAATPEVTKALKEATRLRHIATIREQLEGKKTPPVTEEEGGKKAPGVGKPAEGETPTMAKKEGKKGEKGEVVADAPGKVTNENKTPSGEQPKEQPVNETGAKLVFSTRDPRSLNESVGLVQRLSASTAK